MSNVLLMSCAALLAFNFCAGATPISDSVELSNLAKTCLLDSECEEMTGGILTKFYAMWMCRYLVREVHSVIGLQELRSVLGFIPIVPWKRPSEDKNNTTLVAYYEQKEPVDTYVHGPRNDLLFEKNVAPAIKVMDKRLPMVRTIYRRYLEDRLSHRKINEDVDFMIAQYEVIHGLVNDATEKIKFRGKCSDDS
ncbi:hypothetical protein GCK72_004064 [Caenorhabditis remanei]|uniref:Uncharacterized protein n=1 Tax=Caenorhabditis remanei TaxID=31234 RepID=A0A6A5HAD1_CAERE|nr:hypothetical protein GCK72_004064 [Caenorhabditis remanei]KAF1764117.1 hypothetical protein GCK72_004064 [Caenorhabditis remanei]